MSSHYEISLSQNRYRNKSGLSKSDQCLRFVSDESLSKLLGNQTERDKHFM